MTREDVLKEFSRPYQSHEDVGGPDADAMADEIVRLRKEFDIATSMLGGKSRIINGLQDEMDHARALLIDLKRWRDEAERSRPIVQAAQAYLDSGGSYTTWLALRQLIPLSETSPYATEP